MLFYQVKTTVSGVDKLHLCWRERATAILTALGATSCM